jgi:hypothetical protein
MLPEKPPGVYRVFLFGESAAMGDQPLSELRVATGSDLERVPLTGTLLDLE